MIRKLISKLNRSLSKQMVSSRRRYKAPLKVWFDPEQRNERARDAARAACILGETVDLSRSGIAFLVPSIRSKEKYLVGQDRVLNVEMDLPSGKVSMRVIGRRYEKVGVHISVEKFLVGASILSIADDDRGVYESFLRRGTRPNRAIQKGLELETD